MQAANRIYRQTASRFTRVTPLDGDPRRRGEFLMTLVLSALGMALVDRLNHH